MKLKQTIENFIFNQTGFRVELQKTENGFKSDEIQIPSCFVGVANLIFKELYLEIKVWHDKEKDNNNLAVEFAFSYVHHGFGQNGAGTTFYFTAQNMFNKWDLILEGQR